MSALQTLDLILPYYNPRPGWSEALIASLTNIKRLLGNDVIQSVILVNDGSNSGVEDSVVERLISAHPEVKLIEYSQNKGKGFAVRTGVRSSEADLQIYTDIDVPYVEESIAEFYQILSENRADVVVASRGNSYYNSLSTFRRVLSRTLRRMNRMLFGLSVADTQGGLKGMNAAGRSVFLRTTINRYLFDLEFIQKASSEELRIEAIDVQLKPDIILPSPSLTILLKELHNFISLLFSR
jgi:glycosyltransferase involved in cell wall biosynthesis